MHFEPFKVQVAEEVRISTSQKVLTAILTLYFFSAFSSIAVVMYFNLIHK